MKETARVRLSITTKMLVIVAALISGVVALFGTLQGASQRRLFSDMATRERQLGEKAVVRTGTRLARGLATSLAPAVAENNYSYVLEVVRSTAREEQHLLHITVADPQGIVVADSRGTPSSSRIADPIASRKTAEVQRRTKVRGGPAMLFAEPARVGQTLVGEVRAVYSLGFLEKQLAEIAARQRAARRATVIRTLSVGGLCVGLGTLLAIIVALSITRPIRRLAHTARDLADGNFAARAALSSKDEVGQLGSVFNHMAERVQVLMAETADKARLEKDLEVARAVQECLIPGDEPLTRGRIQVAGFYQPASMCGGDWWGYFDLPNDRLLVVIGDVTGHGVSSAMITATAKSACDVTRELVGEQLTVSLLMRSLNTAVHAAGQRLLMTCFATLIDCSSGELSYASAGHPRPLLSIAERGGKLSSLRTPPGQQLGEAAQWEGGEGAGQLNAGDVALWYTDGITEGMDPSGKPYGEKKLGKSLRAAANLSIAEARNRVVGDVFGFFQDRPQDDDITLVMAKVSG